MQLFITLLLLLPFLLCCNASQVKHERQDPSYASELIVTETTGTVSAIKFFPSRASDSALWTIAKPTTLSSGQVVDPQGYEWAASGVFNPPAIPSGAPFPRPANSSGAPLGTGPTSSLSTTSSISATHSSLPITGTGSFRNSTINLIPPSTRASISSSASSIGQSSTGTGSTNSTLATSSSSSFLTGVGSVNSTGIKSSSSSPTGTETLLSSAFPSSSVLSIPGTGVLPFPTSSSSSSSSISGSSAVPFTFNGSWSASSTPSPASFTWFDIPTTTISNAAATSEAVILGGLFFALQSNRQWVTDPNLRSQYIDDVQKTKDETLALFNDLGVQPPADAPCSSTKRKRSAISEKKLRSLLRKRSLITGLTDLVGDAAKLISCAVNVVNNLVDAVEADDPPISEIELLTDTLADIGSDLEEEDDQNSSTTQESSASSSSSSSSCTGSTAVPICTQTISLSTSFMSGGTSVVTVETVTTSVCSTTTIAGCSGAGTTVTTTTSGPACTAFTIPTADDPEEDGADLDPNDLKRRSIAGRIKLEARARAGPTTFGNCPVPPGFAPITFPGNPTVKQISAIEGSTKPTDQPLLNGIARYYDRDVTCPDGVTNLLQRSSVSTASDYSMDHVWELKLLLEFFKTITPPVASNVFTDCNNFNQVFFPSPASSCNNLMQNLYNQVPTNANFANNQQIEFAAMLKDLNNKKGIIFKPNEFTNANWMSKNLPAGNVAAWIVVLQDVSIAMAICNHADVVPLFDKTNLRIYNAFQGIDQMVIAKKIGLKDPTFSFAAQYQSWINGFLTQQSGATWTFIQKLMTDTQTAINALDSSDPTKAQFQTQLDSFKNGAFGQQSHYSFSFNTNLASAGGNPLAFKRSLEARQDSCSIDSGSSSSASGSATGSSISATWSSLSVSASGIANSTFISASGTSSPSLSSITSGNITSTGPATRSNSTQPSSTNPPSITLISSKPSAPSSTVISTTAAQTSSADISSSTGGPVSCYSDTKTPNVTFTLDDATSQINAYCKKYDGQTIGDSQGSAILVSTVDGSSTGDSIILSAAVLTYDQCSNTDPSTVKIVAANCSANFLEAVNNCDTNTQVTKYGGTKNAGCIQYRIQGWNQAPQTDLTATPTSTPTPTPTPSPSPSPTQAPPPTITAEIFIAFQDYEYEGFVGGNQWNLYTSTPGTKYNACNNIDEFGDDKIGATTSVNVKDLPWPDGTFKFGEKVFGESGCIYTGTSDAPGQLTCSNGFKPVDCIPDPQAPAAIDCGFDLDGGDTTVYPKVICQWG